MSLNGCACDRHCTDKNTAGKFVPLYSRELRCYLTHVRVNKLTNSPNYPIAIRDARTSHNRLGQHQAEPTTRTETRRNLRPSQDIRFEHTFTVHVLVVVYVVVTPAPEAVAFSPVVVVIVAVALGPEAVPHHGASSYCYCYFLLLSQHPGMHGGIDRGDLAV